MLPVALTAQERSETFVVSSLRMSGHGWASVFIHDM